MKSISTIATALVAFLLFASASVAAASITFPDVLEVHNDVPYQGANTFEFNKGRQLIELTYRDIFADNADDSGAWIKSDPLYLTLELAADAHYRITLPNIDSEQEARAFIQRPKVTLIGSDGQVEPLALLNHQELMAMIWISK
ncbi:DUF2057 family protein [Shewanella colwelliana]|uniref:DUF2057 family protein n=1 Tax=Shewanella colwelliana TaxID=23 RepID=UPI00299E83B9|nr:DUF2057 family protein [Shewanella colwelliana]MDX1281085.1 DUF2057 family protein [Shewanella colwelliana]